MMAPCTHSCRTPAAALHLTVMHTFKSSVQEAQQDTGISTDLIMCFLRHEGAEPAWKTLQQVVLRCEISMFCSRLPVPTYAGPDLIGQA